MLGATGYGTLNELNNAIGVAGPENAWEGVALHGRQVPPSPLRQTRSGHHLQAQRLAPRESDKAHRMANDLKQPNGRLPVQCSTP
jgi:hypothetical protein